MYNDNESNTDAKMENNLKYLEKRLDILLEKQLRRKVTFAKKSKSRNSPPDVETTIFSFFNGGKTRKKIHKKCLAHKIIRS